LTPAKAFTTKDTKVHEGNLEAIGKGLVVRVKVPAKAFTTEDTKVHEGNLEAIGKGLIVRVKV